MDFLSSFLLFLVVHKVRHDGLVVRDVHAKADGDGFAFAMGHNGIAVGVESA